MEKEKNRSLDLQLKTQAMQEILNKTKQVIQDPFRFHYHIMPPVGLLNDPNGFVYFKGFYHLFFQWNPFATNHRNKFWAHMTSTNLVDWKWQSIALAPSDWFDKDGCYSGSAIENEGKLYLFYTGNVRDSSGDRKSYQCLAVSEDGIQFEKKGPLFTVPDGYTAHFRDPKVWKEKEQWYLVIGAQTNELLGCALLYHSPNLFDWELVGEVRDPNIDYSDFGYMWECPDLLPFKEQDALLFSPQGMEPEEFRYQNIYQTGYILGELNRKNGCFIHQPFVELDSGFDFYAPQTTIDQAGRRILFGWMGLPEESEAYHPTKAYHWIHAMTIPRELILRDNHLYQQPVKELKQLRSNQIIDKHKTSSQDEVIYLTGNHEAMEFQFQVNRFQGDAISFTFDKNTTLRFDAVEQMLTLTRANFRTNQLESRKTELKSLTDLHIYLDTSSIEVFVNQGEKVFSARLFEDLLTRQLTIKVTGTLQYDVSGWQLNKVMR
ncbi:glycoside hydrolase family 32 protein [Paraliobacillus sp. JSM ZJ581]|uniref:glycoside hydrolase family 32 protein n=1 Tax=Paraliobacillus sp. JSM ZJ581 TaxID=3342118 RepID=UPI0035A89F62